MNGGWLCSLTMWVSGSSFLLLQVVDTSFSSFLGRQQSECVNDTTEVLFTEKQASVTQDTGEECAP